VNGQRHLNRNRRQEGQAAIAASGAAFVFFTVPFGPSWEIKQITITSTSTLETSARTFIGTNSAGILISQSFTGNDDTDSQPNVTLRSGDSVCCVWEGGTPGAIVRLTVIFDEVDY
jgi:hypothetical protein